VSATRDPPVALLAVCGLDIEVRIVASPFVRTVAGGGDRRALAAAIHRHLDDGATALISFGLAGALDPSLRAGALVVPDAIVHGGRREPVDLRWTDMLRRALPEAAHGVLAGSDVIVADADAKRDLRCATEACAVDTESHVAARIARERGVPFVALRAISDGAHRSLPPAATVAMRPDGRIDLVAVLRSVLGSPGQLPGLVRTGVDTQAALRSLRRGRRLLGARLGYADLDELPVDVV